jgi:hypothetical protein
MGLSMSERRAVTKRTSARYRRASKKEKAKILDEYVHTTGYHRKYAGWILSNWGTKRYCLIDGQLVGFVMGQPRKRKKAAGRPRQYDQRVYRSLKKVWFIWDCPCGKRMVPVLRVPSASVRRSREEGGGRGLVVALGRGSGGLGGVVG